MAEYIERHNEVKPDVRNDDHISREGMPEHGKYCPIMVAGRMSMSVSVLEKIALGGYPMQTTVRCLLLRRSWLIAQFARMYLKLRHDNGRR